VQHKFPKQKISSWLITAKYMKCPNRQKNKRGNSKQTAFSWELLIQWKCYETQNHQILFPYYQPFYLDFLFVTFLFYLKCHLKMSKDKFSVFISLKSHFLNAPVFPFYIHLKCSIQLFLFFIYLHHSIKNKCHNKVTIIDLTT